jgi:hypothetical protein
MIVLNQQLAVLRCAAASSGASPRLQCRRDLILHSPRPSTTHERTSGVCSTCMRSKHQALSALQWARQ